MPNRPQDVPEIATSIAPGQTFGPGIGVQQVTIKSILAQDAQANARADSYYAQALKDWITNAQIDAQLGLRIPPVPPAPQHIVPHIVYSMPDGTIVTGPEGADGSHWAWVWETWE